MWRRLSALVNIEKKPFSQKLKLMAETITAGATSDLKRPADSDDSTVPAKFSKKDNKQKKKKKPKPHIVQLGQSEGFKRKIALLVSYNGSGYYGVQINGDFPTIEKDLFSALVTTGAIPQEHANFPSKMWFQRGSRTDKGVSAVGQTFSLKAVLIPDFVNKVNESLPEKIRIMGYIRTTNGFDSKNFCCGRTYTYMSPTFAFAPIEKFITDDFRVDPPVIDRIREILKKFVGTHNFHNFTSGVKHDQASASRYITGFECSDPYIREGLEFVTITVKGQSFMLHQIRKMIGLTIAVVRGYCGEATIEKCWSAEKVDVPKAPGLGLVLEELHFNGYNKKFGSDGIHEPIDWSPYREEMAKFKEKYIISDIVSQEKESRVMFNWMRTLQFHNFAEPRQEGPERPWQHALQKGTLSKNPTDGVETNQSPSSSQPPDSSEMLTQAAAGSLDGALQENQPDSSTVAQEKQGASAELESVVNASQEAESKSQDVAQGEQKSTADSLKHELIAACDADSNAEPDSSMDIAKEGQALTLPAMQNESSSPQQDQTSSNSTSKLENEVL